MTDENPSETHTAGHPPAENELEIPRLMAPFEVLYEQSFARKEPGDATTAEGHGWSRVPDHDQSPLRGASQRFIEVVDLIANVVQPTASFQELLHRGSGIGWFDQFYAWIAEVAWVDERDAHTLEGVIPSLRPTAPIHRSAEAFHDRGNRRYDEAGVVMAIWVLIRRHRCRPWRLAVAGVHSRMSGRYGALSWSGEI